MLHTARNVVLPPDFDTDRGVPIEDLTGRQAWAVTDRFPVVGVHIRRTDLRMTDRRYLQNCTLRSAMDEFIVSMQAATSFPKIGLSGTIQTATARPVFFLASDDNAAVQEVCSAFPEGRLNAHALHCTALHCTALHNFTESE